MSRDFSFDRIAPVYDKLSYLAFRGSVTRAQRYFLSTIPPQSNVLIVGGGNGDILIDLLERVVPAHITYVEASVAMMHRAKRKITGYRQTNSNLSLPTITFIQGTERDVDSTKMYQVAITNFVLDMYQGSSLDGMMQRIDSLLSEDAVWLFTDFRYSSRLMNRIWQKPLAQFMYIFFHFTANISVQALPNYDSHFRKVGWDEKQHQSFFGDFISSNIYTRTKQISQRDFSSKNR